MHRDDHKRGALGASVQVPRRSRIAKALIALLVGVVTPLGAGELGLRFLLFSKSDLATRYGERLRHPDRFTKGPLDEDYWKLLAMFDRRPPSQRHNPDPLLGWTGSNVRGTYFSHRDEYSIAGRRPILLYGDSNAQCMTSREDCFEGLLAASDLAPEYALLNYGVGGYGLDQTYLMLKHSIDRFAERDPIVIVSLMVDDNLERSLLGLRVWPKPRFGLEQGQLVPPQPVLTDVREHLARHPPRIRSYLYRLVRERLAPTERSWPPSATHPGLVRELNTAILNAICEELEARSLRYFFFLFCFEATLRGSPSCAWSEQVVMDFLHATGTPYVSMRDALETLGDPPWRPLRHLIGWDPVLAGHFNRAGNELAFELMRQGLEGGFDPDRLRRLAAEGAFAPGDGM